MKFKAAGVIASLLIIAAPHVSFAAALPTPFEASSTLQAEGVVQSLDQVAHTVTVLDAHGGRASFNITDPRDLTQIGQGGKVHLRMTRNAVVSVMRGADGQVATAEPIHSNDGQNVNAVVEAVDHASGVLALKGADGAIFHIQSQEPAKAASIAVGMQVLVAFASQVSVAVAPVSAPASTSAPVVH
ncbi:hypothetical protein [Paraburkholderia sp. BCC1886]|uniref:hypothetical protein n=1 Tax=Paraburkholderia sp. BCC1886 TaxID=2562670 RepID=UPI001184160C|nr:hypothetical protein [Paraburkholderia sp. BCC1886]